MSAKERLLHKMTRSDTARNAYSVLRGIPIVGPGIRKLVHAALPPGTKMWVKIPGGLGKGFQVYSDPRFELGYTNGDHEPWLQELLRSELRPGDCFYDVGAHTGFFALIASRYVGPSGKIVAFEPDPENAATFQKNMARNGVSQATLVKAAVWSSPGEVTFQRALDASNRTQGQIMTATNSRLEHISVPAVCLDTFIFGEGNPIPQLIKMDVEGAEWGALQGARRLLQEAKPKLLCEIHDPGQMSQICDYLQQFGYAAEEWNPVHEHYADYRQLYIWAVPTVQRVPAVAGSEQK